MKKILLIASFCHLILSASAQYKFDHFNGSGTDSVFVKESNIQFKNAFAGGMDVPQFGTCDLDLDGKLDLVIFDREGYKISTFLNKGGNNEIKYIYAPQYVKHFPKMVDWMQLVDYNGDGKMDIFCAIPGGLRLYKNISNSTTGLMFENTFPEINCDYTSLVTRLYIGNIDIPAILDVDDDGDVDILTFYQSIDSSGESIYWYKNMSMERYNKPDSMDFIVGKYCWGRFRESYTDCKINLQYPIGLCGNGGRFTPNISAKEFMANLNDRIQKSNDPAHSGSTTLIMDVNGDGLKDMLIGDVTCTEMYAVINNNTNADPIMTQTIHNYPPNNPIYLEMFPAAYLLDINNDGLKDLIASTNTSNASMNTNHVLSYMNNGTQGIGRYTFSNNDFLLEEMVDVGEGSAATFVDYNVDGLMDIVVSNSGYWQSSSSNKTGLMLMKNIGTSTLPSYEVISRDWLGLSSLNIANMSPDFEDMDNDGDLDMVCGSSDGTLHYFTNTAGANSTINLQYVPNYFGTLDVGNFSIPFVYDFNGDGKNDIAVGERYDNINLIENIGTVNAPNYAITTDSLYKINLKIFGNYPNGRAKLVVSKIRPNENPRVILSNANGKIYIMDEVNSNINKKMSQATDSIDLNSGIFSFSNGGFVFSMADLTNDSKPEIIVGTPQGGLLLYKNNSLNVGLDQQSKRKIANVYPNPFNEYLTISSNNNELLTEISIIDLNGKEIHKENVNKRSTTISTKQLINGMYIVRIKTSNEVSFEKLLKN